MRVTFNSTTDELARQLGQLASLQQAAEHAVSSGHRINSVDEDPIAAAKVLELRNQNRRATQEVRNLDHALDISTAAFSVLEHLKGVSDRAGEIAVLADGVVTPEQRTAYLPEIDSLIEVAISASSTQLGREYLFSGAKTDTAPFAVTRSPEGKVTGVAYQGADSGAEIPIGRGQFTTPFTSGTENSQIATFVNRLVALRDAVQFGDSVQLKTARGDLALSEEDLLDSVARSGAKQSRLQMVRSNAAERFEQAEARISTLADVDLSQAIVRYNQSQVAYQAALQSASKIMGRSLLDYLR